MSQRRTDASDGAKPELEAEASPAAEELPPHLTSLLEASSGPAASSSHVVGKVGPDAVPPLATLGLAKILEVEQERVLLGVGSATVYAPLGMVHPSVLKTACERGEPVLVERAADGSLRVVGALRMQPTPGVDAMEEVEIEADRIHLRGKQEITLESSTTARIALRAAGEIETYASRILSKAEEVHKIVGRMLRLN